MKRLIVNADDFGLTSGISRAIIECHDAGAVSSTTLLVNGLAAGEAAALAAGRPSLGVGLHFNLTFGKPVAPAGEVPSLVGADGLFPGVAAALLRLSTGRARARELEIELAAQIGRCLELGFLPTHVDSHHHLHAHPRLRRLIGLIAPRMGIHRIRGYHMRIRGLKGLAIAAGAAFPAGGSLLSPDRFSGIAVMGTRNMAGWLAAELGARGDVLEFMCHPGHADEQLAAVSSYNSLRQVEFEGLLDEGFARVIRSDGVRLMSYREL